MNTLVELQNISLPPLLKEIRLTVTEDKIVTLIGPNGAGKTTLLKIILGFVKPSKGRIVYRPALKIGYMPQKINLNKVLPLSVERFLRLSPYKKFAEEALEGVGAASLKNRSIHILSGGEMQRILLARAIMGTPDLLILDEPDQGLDLMGQAELYKVIASLKKRLRCGIVLVSHDLHFVHASSDHVICLNQHICCEGRPEEVKANPAYSRLFPEKLLEDLAPYAHHHDHKHS